MTSWPLMFLLNTDYTDFTDSLVWCDHWCFFYWTRITRISRIILCFLTMGPKPPVLTPPNKNIRVIREIRVQTPYAPRLNKDIRVPWQKKESVFRPPLQLSWNKKCPLLRRKWTFTCKDTRFYLITRRSVRLFPNRPYLWQRMLPHCEPNWIAQLDY